MHLQLGNIHPVMISSALVQDPNQSGPFLNTQEALRLPEITETMNCSLFAIKNRYNSSHIELCFGIKMLNFPRAETRFWYQKYNKEMRLPNNFTKKCYICD